MGPFLVLRNIYIWQLLFCFIGIQSVAADKLQDDSKIREKRIKEFMDALCRDQIAGLPSKYFPVKGIKIEHDCGNGMFKKLKPNRLDDLCGLFHGTASWHPARESEKLPGSVYRVNFNNNNVIMKFNYENQTLLEVIHAPGSGDCGYDY